MGCTQSETSLAVKFELKAKNVVTFNIILNFHTHFLGFWGFGANVALRTLKLISERLDARRKLVDADIESITQAQRLCVD